MLAAALLVGSAVAVLWLVRRRWQLVVVRGNSMAPTLLDGQQLLARRGRAYRRGDLVVFRPPRPPGASEAPPGDPPYRIKRVAAIAGDPVPPWLPHTGVPRVPPHHLVVRGDHPVSEDSRHFGFVPHDAVLGTLRSPAPPRGSAPISVAPVSSPGDAVAMEDVEETSDPRLWKKDGWIARVIKNENDEGWAVSMTRVGDAEPSLVSPWTMGRDKVNPKPLNHNDFKTLLKGANDVLRRAEAALHASLHRSITCKGENGQALRADLDIQRDEDDPHAILSVVDLSTKETLRSGRVSPASKLSEANVQRFLRTGDV